MNANFWHQKWERGDIGFHESEANPVLIEHFEKLNLAKGSRVFIPLCGKSRDCEWLLANGFQVVGAELSELAISELFKELSLTPEIFKVGKLTQFSATNIDMLVGDIFDVSAEYLGTINAIYDRAALVALPAFIRAKYTAHMMSITNAAPQLLITYEYNQILMDGPPFSVNEKEVMRHYGDTYQLKSVEIKNVAGGLKGKTASAETAWLLQKINK